MGGQSHRLAQQLGEPRGHHTQPTHLALTGLAIGAGSLFFSHVNDAGFWLVKEYFGLTVGQTIKSWSLMETVISVMGFLVALLLSTFRLTRPSRPDRRGDVFGLPSPGVGFV